MSVASKVTRCGGERAFLILPNNNNNNINNNNNNNNKNNKTQLDGEKKKRKGWVKKIEFCIFCLFDIFCCTT